MVRAYVVHRTRFELPTRYEVFKANDHEGGGAIGYGSFGAVCEAFDRALGEPVMVKKVEGVRSRSRDDVSRMVQEMKLLSRMSHPGIVQILNMFTTSGGGGDGEIDEFYVVTSRMDSTLLEVVRSKQVLTRQHVQVFAFQLLDALRYLKDCGVVATRLCPANIMCGTDCSILIGELGGALPYPPVGPTPNLSRWGGSDHNERSEVWYKAPEILLKAEVITPAADLWSVGAIIAELMTRRPLFAGESPVHQIRLITDVIGMTRPKGFQGTSVSESEVAESASGELQFIGTSSDAAEARRFVLSLAPKIKVPLRTIIPTADKFLIDMLERLLQFNPNSRSSALELLSHPIFRGVGVPQEVKVTKSPDEDIGLHFDGMVLDAVDRDSPSHRCGVGQHIGYTIVSINGLTVMTPDAVRNALRACMSSTSFVLHFGKMERNPLGDWVTPSTSTDLAMQLKTFLAEYPPCE